MLQCYYTRLLVVPSPGANLSEHVVLSHVDRSAGLVFMASVHQSPLHLCAVMKG